MTTSVRRSIKERTHHKHSFALLQFCLKKIEKLWRASCIWRRAITQWTKSQKKEHYSKDQSEACRHRHVNAMLAWCRLLAIRSTMRLTCWKIDQIRKSNSSQHSRRRHATRSLNLFSSLEIDLQTTEDDKELAKRRFMMTQSTFFILQYKVRNKKNDTMIFLLIDSRLKKYDLLIIQKS
jgi:hypothetical protein